MLPMILQNLTLTTGNKANFGNGATDSINTYFQQRLCKITNTPVQRGRGLPLSLKNNVSNYILTKLNLC